MMSQTNPMKFIMISAMYENGGNTTHRFLDGHPELYTYPFESQIGNMRMNDYMSSLYPPKYRYPEFPLNGNVAEDFELFFDEEFKTCVRARHVSKFRDADFVADDKDRKAIFCDIMSNKTRSRANLVAAFFEATFKAWKNYNHSGKENAYVGYSPVIGFDGEAILTDFPNGHVVHVVRNPWSGFADTSKRPYPLSVQRYAWTWAMIQHHALVFEKRFAGRYHIVRFEDLVENPELTMRDLAKKLDLPFNETMTYVSWNGKKMDSVYPWGTIRTPTPDANFATANELNDQQKAEITSIAGIMGNLLGYSHYLQGNKTEQRKAA
jgi:hypothetical protein